MADTLRLGVIGAGFIGRVHLQKFGALEQVRLAGISDADSQAARAAAASFGVHRVFESPQALIDSSEVDAVVIGVPNHLHADLAVAALEAGKHVLLEKPMARTLPEAQRIARAQAGSGRVLMIAHQLRFAWASRHVATHLAELGEVYNAKTGWWRRQGIPGWGSWFTRRDHSGGGPLIDIGVHMLDLALSLLGDPEPVRVFGSTYAKFGPEKRGIGTWGTPQWDGVFDVEDLATAMIKFADGRTLTLEVSWAANTARDGGFLELMGQRAGAAIYGDRVVFTSLGFGQPYNVEATAPADAPDPRTLLSNHFVDCVLHGKQPTCDARCGLRTMAILAAIYQSSHSGEAVSLDTGTGPAA